MHEILRFGDFELNLQERRLTRAGLVVELSPRCMDVLVILAQADGEAVRRSTLAERAWANESVTDGAINFTLHKLRRSLGAYGEKFIETVPGIGYRLRLDTPRHAAATFIKPADPVIAERPLVRTAAVPSNADQYWWPKLSWRYVTFVSLALLAVTVVVKISSATTQPYVVTYHQLTNDGKEKWGPLLRDGKYVYFAETINAGDQLAYRWAYVPANGTRDAQLMKVPGPAPCLADIAQEGQFLIRLDGQQPVGPYYWWIPGAGQLIPTHATGTCRPALSPDHRFIADARSDQITISTLAGNGAERIVRIANPICPRWSSDGRRIRFVVRDEKLSANAVWECNNDGSGLHLVVNEGTDLLPNYGDWTRDGRLYVFPRTTDRNSDLWAWPEGVWLRRRLVSLTNGPLYWVDLRSSIDSSQIFAIGRSARGELVRFDRTTHVSTPFLGGISAIDVNFSRDGQWVAYQRFPEHTLWRSRLDGADVLQLTPPDLQAFQPHWSPDGTKIGFMGYKPGGLFRAYIVRFDGTGLEQLKVDDDFDQGVPSWSADGTKIVYGELLHRKPGNEMAIHLVDVRTRSESIIPGSKGKWTPRWSPDGNYIVAQTPDFKSLVLYDIRAQLWRLLVGDLNEVDDPTWSADNKFVYFRYLTAGSPGQQIIARICLDCHAPEILAWDASMPQRLNAWFTIAPDNSILLLRSVRIQEIYALDLGWR